MEDIAIRLEAITTSNKKLLGTKGITTSNPKLLEAKRQRNHPEVPWDRRSGYLQVGMGAELSWAA